MFLHNGKIFNGSDRIFHIERLEEAFKAFQNGHFIPMISTFSFSRVGQAINVYYPWGNLLPYVLIRYFVGASVRSYYIYIGVEQFFGLLIAYFSAVKVSGQRLRDLAFAIILRFSTYIMFNDFPRADVGESWAMIFIPLTFAGFYVLAIKGEYLSGTIMMVLGLTAEVYCHILTSVLTVGTLLILYLVSLSYQKDKIKVVTSLFVSVATFFMISSSFMIPFLNFMTHNKVVIPTLGDENYADYFRHSRSLSQVIKLSLDNTVLRGEPNIGLVLILASFFGVLFLKKSSNFDRICYFMGLSFLFLGTTLLPWLFSSSSLIRAIQFPWRLLSISIVFLAYFLAGKIYLRKTYLILTLAIVLYGGLTSLRQFEYSQNHKIAESTNELNKPWGYAIDNKNYDEILSMHRDIALSGRVLDYLPKDSKVDRQAVFNHEVTVGNKRMNLEKDQILSEYQSATFLIPQFNKKNENIVLPFYIYNANSYFLYVNGKRTKLSKTNESLATFKANTNSEIKVTVRYKAPSVYIVARYISLTSIILLLVTYFISEYRSYKKLSL